MNPILADAQKVFFEAMRNGWAGSKGVKSTIQELPGSKLIQFTKGEFTLKDHYFDNNVTLNSMGDKEIWKEGVACPIWKMSYGGFYYKEAIPFLKKALLSAYENNLFFGGRGPEFFEDEEYVYINMILRNKFSSFAGEEKILERSSGRVMGFHTYWGMGLTFHT